MAAQTWPINNSEHAALPYPFEDLPPQCISFVNGIINYYHYARWNDYGIKITASNAVLI